MEIRFIILPPARVRLKTKTLAFRASSMGKHYFVVDNDKLIPHVTLFKIKFSKTLLLKVSALVKEEVLKYKIINLLLHRLYPHPEGWLVWDIKPSAELSQLRNGLAQKVSSILAEPLRIKKPFRPHITLTRFRNPVNASEAAKNNIKPFPWKAGIIAIALSDDQSQVYKIISTHRLYGKRS